MRPPVIWLATWTVASILSVGCADSGSGASLCDRAAGVLATCGQIVDQSPFGTCQPAQRKLAAEVVAVYDQRGCAALVNIKADSFLCSELPFLCVTHTVDELQPFVTDGCSMFPDGTPSNRTWWQHCCITHDFAYYAGGSADLRAAADDGLAACIASEVDDAFGNLMRAGVRVGGTPALNTPWRWGYGWTYDALNGYRDLPDDQRAAAQAQIDAYMANPVPPDALEQRLDRLSDSIVSVPGLQEAMRAVQDEVDKLDQPPLP